MYSATAYTFRYARTMQQMKQTQAQMSGKNYLLMTNQVDVPRNRIYFKNKQIMSRVARHGKCDYERRIGDNE